MELCCTGVFVLAVVAAFGRGVWAVAELFFRHLLHPAQPAPAPFPTLRRSAPCAGCERLLLPGDDRCPGCGLDPLGPAAAAAARARQAIAEVLDLADLDTATAERVAAALRNRVRTLLAPPAPAPAPAPTPVADGPPEPLYVPAPAPEPPAPVPLDPEFLPEATPAPPRRGALAGFMEERNIFWGELVGGALIVGCSIALVLSLWRRLEDLPYFPFLLASGITAALFAAGQYTLHHWRLTATSRGLLVTAVLLAPLNLLLLAVPGTGGGGALDLAVKAAAVLGFVAMARAAGRDLIGIDVLPGPVDRRWLFATAVVGPPAVLLLPLAPSPWLPLACHVGACVAVLGGLTWYRRAAAPEPISDRIGTAVLVFVGVSLFALAAAWGLLVSRAADPAAAVRGFALPLVAAAVPVLEAGLLVQRRLAAGFAGLRATGTGVAVGGGAALAVGATLAWPDAPGLTVAAALAGAVFTRVAWRERLAEFLFGAVPALALAAVLAVHGAAGNWPDADGPALARLLGASTSGATLTGFALLLAAVGELAARRGHAALGFGYAVGGLAAAFAGLLLVTGHGPEDPWPAAAAYLAAAVGLVAANARWKEAAATRAGVFLLLPATLWTLWAVRPAPPSLWGVTLAAESFAFAVAALALTPRAARVGAVRARQLRVGCRDAAAGAAVLAAGIAAGMAGFPHGWPHAAAFLTLAASGLVLARVAAHPAFTWAGSAAGLVGLLVGTYQLVELRPVTLVVMPALVAHAVLALGAAWRLGGKPSRERLFAFPLRTTATLTSLAAAALLFGPPPGFRFEWAIAAGGVAAVWFALAWVWRERWAFPAGHAALTAAAVLAGLGAAETSGWPGRIGNDPFDAHMLRHVWVAVGVLGALWVVARLLGRGNARLRELWLTDRLAVDRVVTVAAVGAQLALLAAAVTVPVLAELTPTGRPMLRPTSGEIFGVETWIPLALFGVVLVAALWVRADDEPPPDPVLIGLLALGFAAAVAWAGGFAPQLAAASALRWGLSAAFVAGSAVVFARRPLGDIAVSLGVRPGATAAATWAAYVTLTAAAAVVVGLTAEVARLGLAGLTPSGPGGDTAFAAMGWTASHVAPLALVVLGLTGTAARERLPGYAFAGGAVFTGAVAGGYALAVVTGGGAIGRVEELRLAMLAAGAMAGWAALWLAAERRVPGGDLLDVQAALGLAAVGLVALVVAARVWAAPGVPLPEHFAEFGWYGWPLLAVAGWAGAERARRVAPALRGHAVGYVSVVAGVVAGCAARPLDAPDRWVTFHVMAAAWAAAGVGLAAALARAPDFARGSWLVVFAALLTLAALREPAPGLSHAAAPLALAAYALAVAAVTADRGRALLAAEALAGGVAALLAVGATVSADPLLDRLGGAAAVALLAVAAGVLGARPAAVLLAAATFTMVGWAVPDPDGAAVWLTRNAWAFAALVAAAVAAHVVRLPGAWGDAARRAGEWVAAAGGVALVLLLGQQLRALDPDTRRTPLPPAAVLAVAAAVLAQVGLAVAAALRPGGGRTWGFYVADGLLVALYVHVRLNRPELLDGAAVPLALAGYVLAVAAVGKYVRPDSADRALRRDLLAAEALAGGVAALLAVGAAVSFDPVADRLGGAGAVALLAFAAGVLGARSAAVAIGAAAVTLVGWAMPDPDGDAVWLTRNAWAFAALVAAAVAAHVARVPGAWGDAARRAGGWVAWAGGVALGLVLVQELLAFDRDARRTPLPLAAVLAVVAGIVALAWLAVAAALRPVGPVAGRTKFVYLAELLLVALFAHVRLNLPELFVGPLVRYWTFVVMALGFVGVGLAELFERRGLAVLAGPLARTGVLLPLLPLLAFWAKPPGGVLEFADANAPGARPFLGYLERLPQHFDSYAGLWLAAGALYGLVAVRRESLQWALLAALATNAAVWSLLAHSGVSAAVHPQVWVIPLALIVLVAEHVNRRELGPRAAAGVRYAGVGLLYLSSAADMFIAGVGESVWLPVVLAVVCVAGILGGILLRVRAFLFLGAGFLLLDVFAQIWHAAVGRGHTWVWYAAGIVLGAAILALFAVFERRRD